LAPVDEFHIGGRQATTEFAEQLDIEPGMRLLDIGCGLSGASRYSALDRGCRVTGIDLTDEYVRVAESLAKRVGLEGAVSYQQGNVRRHQQNATVLLDEVIGITARQVKTRFGAAQSYDYLVLATRRVDRGSTS
jgi:cyclopropane fatty-acyl-phospholipid synthase-like methyltransferase